MLLDRRVVKSCLSGLGTCGTLRLSTQSMSWERSPIPRLLLFDSYLQDDNDVKTLVRDSHTKTLFGVVDPAGNGHPGRYHDISQDSDEDLKHIIRDRA